MKTVTNCWFWISIWVFVCTLWVSMMGLGSENHTADIEMFIIVVCAEKTMKMSLVCLCKYAMLYMIWGCCCFAFGPKMSNKPDTELLTTDVYFQSVILFYDLQINCFIWVMPLSFYLQAQQLTDAPMWQESSSAAAIWCFPGRAFLLSCQGFFLPFYLLMMHGEHTRTHTCGFDDVKCSREQRLVGTERLREKRGPFHLTCSGFFWNYKHQWS